MAAVMESFSSKGLDMTLACGLFVVIALILSRVRVSRVLKKYPLLLNELGSYQKREQEYTHHAKELYREGYRKFKSTIYRLTTTDRMKLVLPIKYLDELRQRSDEEVSMEKAIALSVESEYTKLAPGNKLIAHVIKAELNPKLGQLNPRLGEEAERVMETELPPCQDWTAVNFHQVILRMVAILSGNVFLGPELCREEEYVRASIDYTVDVFSSVRLLKQWSKSLRWLGAWFTPELKGIQEHHDRAEVFLTPIIQKRREMMRKGEELPDDMLQWLLNRENKFNTDDDAKMAKSQLVLSMAAVHTSTNTLLNILYDLVTIPDVIPALRAEVDEVLQKHDGVFTTKALYDMKLIDSVMKESQRLNPLGSSRFDRVVLKDITLSDGTFIPANTLIGIPNGAVLCDPEIYPDPDKFDPYRFYNLRQAGEQHINRHQFVTVTKENTNFGWGRHACPGRFFAANQIKLLLANLLLQFDLKMKDEDAKHGRFKNWETGTTIMADPTKELLLRKKGPE